MFLRLQDGGKMGQPCRTLWPQLVDFDESRHMPVCVGYLSYHYPGTRLIYVLFQAITFEAVQLPAIYSDVPSAGFPYRVTAVVQRRDKIKYLDISVTHSSESSIQQHGIILIPAGGILK